MGREIVSKLAGAIENRDPEALTELFTDDAVLHHPLSPEPIQGKAMIVASAQALFDAFSDIHVEVLRVAAEGGDVAMEVILRATNTGAIDVGADESLPATGRRIELASVWFLTLGSDGRITEERDYLDTASLFRQLGRASEM
jgi:steroid delta-isomerase-like uncharacterized protein